MRTMFRVITQASYAIQTRDIQLKKRHQLFYKTAGLPCIDTVHVATRETNTNSYACTSYKQTLYVSFSHVPK